MDVPYPMALGLPDLDSLIDHRIDQLIRKDFSSSSTSGPSAGQLAIVFLDKDGKKKKLGWFGSKDDDPHASKWESWFINVNCLPLSSANAVSGDDNLNKAERLLQLSIASFEENLLEIMTLVDKSKDHIPPIMTLDVSPFPYEIVVDPKGQPPAADDETWSQYIKKIMD